MVLLSTYSRERKYGYKSIGDTDTDAPPVLDEGQALTGDGGWGARLSITQAGRNLETPLLPNAAV